MDTYMKGLKIRNITDARVMGGTDAVLSEALFFCQIFNFNKDRYTFCGGAAIAERFIVSSSHCFNKEDSLQKIKVRIGTTKLGRGGHTIGIKKIIAHDSEDLALLLTEDDIESGNRIELSSRAERLGEIGTFFGFGISGFLNSHAKLPTTLQKTSIVVKGTIRKRAHLFATSGNLMDGDSGGGIIWKEHRKPVIGGIYHGLDLKNNIRIFVRAKDFKTWISDQMAMAL
uniref:Peptidase S1 domain-containing protein n=1 Tax=Meloidogyne incognita TaxID=6306 RepID=A0A914M665_MELIC